MPSPDVDGPLDRYLAEIARRLPGSRRARRDIVDELRDGLLEAADRCRGRGRAEAVRGAIAEFGTPAEVAAAHAPGLLVDGARRRSWRILALLLLAGLTWQLGYDRALGVPASVVPASGPSRDVFLLSTDAVAYPPLVAALGAIGLLAMTGPRATGRHLARLTGVVVAALGAHVLAMTAILVIGGGVLWTGGRAVVLPLLVALVAVAFAESLRGLGPLCSRHGSSAPS